MLPTQEFLEYNQQNALFEMQDRILLAVSGGKDSVLMVHLFKALNVDIGIAHCNFNLRKEEAPRDELFVRKLAEQLKVPFFVTHFDTQTFATKHHLSTQMAARELRYQWFEEIRSREQYDFIALAHHKNDVVETMLLNLLRGTGISGLHGILPKKNKLIRPLLFLSSQEIIHIVAKNKIDYVEDSSNASEKYARNKIRLSVVPILQQLNPNLVDTFQQNAQRFLETEQALQQLVSITKSKICIEENNEMKISLNEIKNLYPQKLLLFEILKQYQFATAVVDDILQSLDKQTGTSFFSPTHCATINRNDLLISVISPQKHNHIQIEEEHFEVSFNGMKLTLKEEEKPEMLDNRTINFSADKNKLIYPLILRYWQHGDSFVPLGMSNFKKISDFFIDKKIPLQHKKNIPILVNGNQEIVWIVGFRGDNRYKITPNTQKIITFTLEKLEDEK